MSRATSRAYNIDCLENISRQVFGELWDTGSLFELIPTWFQVTFKIGQWAELDWYEFFFYEHNLF